MNYIKEHTEYGMVYCCFENHYINGKTYIVPNEQIGNREGELFEKAESQQVLEPIKNYYLNLWKHINRLSLKGKK